MATATNYIAANGETIDALFAYITSGETAAADTGFLMSDGRDLSALYCPLTYGSAVSANTGFITSSGNDLRNIFAATGTNNGGTSGNSASINGGGLQAGSAPTYTFNLSISYTGASPSGYSWSSSGNGSFLGSTTGSTASYELTRNTSTTITCAVSYSGSSTLYPTTQCEYDGTE